jgi:hypothetical protein
VTKQSAIAVGDTGKESQMDVHSQRKKRKLLGYIYRASARALKLEMPQSQGLSFGLSIILHQAVKLARKDLDDV